LHVLYELAGEFSTFYNADKVAVAEAPVRARRLMLCNRTLLLLETGLQLLGLRQQRLDPTEVEQRVARVGLLDDAGDDVALAARVLLVLHLALGLADPLQDDLLGGLRGNAAEVVRGDLVSLYAALVDARKIEPDLVALFVEHAQRLYVDVFREDELVDADLAGGGVYLHLGVVYRVGRLLVRRVQRVFQSAHERIEGDALLFLYLPHGLDDLFTHDGLRGW